MEGWWFYLGGLASLSVSYGRLMIFLGTLVSLSVTLGRLVVTHGIFFLSGYSVEFVNYSFNAGSVIWKVLSLSIIHVKLVVLCGYSVKFVNYSCKVGGFMWILC